MLLTIIVNHRLHTRVWVLVTIQLSESLMELIRAKYLWEFYRFQDFYHLLLNSLLLRISSPSISISLDSLSLTDLESYSWVVDIWAWPINSRIWSLSLSLSWNALRSFILRLNSFNSSSVYDFTLIITIAILIYHLTRILREEISWFFGFFTYTWV